MSKKKKAPAPKGQSPSIEKDHRPKPVALLPDWLQRYQTGWILLGMVLLLVVLYFQTLLNGKPFLGGDVLNASLCYQPFVNDALDRGIYPLWNPYIFSGMPSFASLSSVPRVNLIDTGLNHFIQLFTSNDFIRIFLNFIFLGWTMLLLLRRFKISTPVAVLAALALIFMPQLVAFGVHGHNTKLLSVVLIPIILYLVDQLFEKRNLLFMALTALALGFQLLRAHVQVCYYTYLLIGFYFLFYVIFEYEQEKRWRRSLQTGALLLGSMALAFGLASIIYLSVLEYAHFSIRGGAEGGLDFKYATGWSFSPLELLTFFIPGFVGFGGATYWGPMGFTDYPLYMGVVILFLAGLTWVLPSPRKVWFFWFIAIFSLLVSFGEHFPVLYGAMFKWLPFFNKFRIPSMIHILLNFSMVILAALGLQALLEFKPSASRLRSPQIPKALRNYVFVFGGFCLLLLSYLFFGQSFFQSLVLSSARVQQNIEQGLAMGYPLKGLQQYFVNPALEMARQDALKMILLLAGCLLILWAYLTQKLSQVWSVVFLTLLVVADLWWVDFKIVNTKLEQNQKQRLTAPANYFRENQVVQFLKRQQQQDLFRIYPLDSPDQNWYMHHRIQSVMGYNPAKLRIYQEMIEKLQLNPRVLGLLNTKYLITERETLPGFQVVPEFANAIPKVYAVPYALPRAFFVQRDTVLLPPAPTQITKVEKEAHRDQIFAFMQSSAFIPHEIAVLEENPPFNIEASDSNQVQITKYDLHQISLAANVVKPAHLILSEVYYPAGWKAFVDGQETKIYKTDYLLRSIFLTPGRHQIEFRFEPRMFRLGLWLSVGILAGLLLIISGYGVRCYLRGANPTPA